LTMERTLARAHRAAGVATHLHLTPAVVGKGLTEVRRAVAKQARIADPAGAAGGAFEPTVVGIEAGPGHATERTFAVRSAGHSGGVAAAAIDPPAGGGGIDGRAGAPAAQQ
jgi:hypothetical protein